MKRKSLPLGRCNPESALIRVSASVDYLRGTPFLCVLTQARLIKGDSATNLPRLSYNDAKYTTIFMCLMRLRQRSGHVG